MPETTGNRIGHCFRHYANAASLQSSSYMQQLNLAQQAVSLVGWQKHNKFTQCTGKVQDRGRGTPFLPSSVSLWLCFLSSVLCSVCCYYFVTTLENQICKLSDKHRLSVTLCQLQYTKLIKIIITDVLKVRTCLFTNIEITYF